MTRKSRPKLERFWARWYGWLDRIGNKKFNKPPRWIRDGCKIVAGAAFLGAIAEFLVLQALYELLGVLLSVEYLTFSVTSFAFVIWARGTNKHRKGKR